MFDAIKKLFSANKQQDVSSLDPKMCVAALLVHLSAVDGESSDEEKAAIKDTLQSYYGLSPQEVKSLLDLAIEQSNDAVDLYAFTSVLNQLEVEEKHAIINMMWQIVFVDQHNHELEDNMVWRVAELIGVSARERTLLRAEVRHAAKIK
ncbi:TerB family tellurite resistance protein [Maritalea mediterranea]|uniref:TerB family tellurite resistance protein n=1 Tax=Maritalea mediterranea TaxID=2909667 RepID=A0ABS9EAS8_9HYPH|nr:TerB family tellurite resistance protein [Maritalea mediterranea]MCF4099947.1 TerB family tellurite resistance protein [Maritalea mediterranea]